MPLMVGAIVMARGKKPGCSETAAPGSTSDSGPQPALIIRFTPFPSIG
jgi:hypothetical protein